MKAALFHARSFFSRARGFLDKMHQVYKNLLGAKYFSCNAFVHLEIQQTAETLQNIHTLFVNSVHLLEFSAKEKPLSCQTRVEVRERSVVVRVSTRFNLEASPENKKTDMKVYMRRDARRRLIQA